MKFPGPTRHSEVIIEDKVFKGIGLNIGAICISALVFFAPIVAAAQTGGGQDVAITGERSHLQVNRNTQLINDTIMSPYCPGRTLSGCPSSEARSLRDDIRQWFEQGSSVSEVKQRLVEQFGAEVLGKPGTAGFGVFAWLVPGIFIVVGGLIIIALKQSAACKVLVDCGEPDVNRKVEALPQDVEDEIRRRMV